MNKIFEQFTKVKVLIVGDVMIDRYLVGEVGRISPEAPVPIVDLKRIDNRLGGAGNVALNIKALGATPFLCSVIGDDESATVFRNLLKMENLSDEGILSDSTRITTVKTRVLAKNQQLLRFDEEITTEINEPMIDIFLRKIIQIIEKQQINVVLFQDYNKGILSENLISDLIAYCNQNNIPTTVDPKKKNFFSYKNITLFKPNLKEVSEALDYYPNPDKTETLEKAAKMLNQRLNNKFTLITLSEKGMYLDNHSQSVLIPTQPRNIADVCGAGDTVISVAALGLALGLDIKETVILANLAGGIVCESVGVVPVDKEKLMFEYQKSRDNN
jgi:rfaE bifunctional protein kinase chain/domain